MSMKHEAETVPVTMYRGAERLMIAAPMPGLEPEDITVEVRDGGRIVLHGELRGALKGQKEILLDEWTVGPYHRELDLPAPIDGAMANLTYNNGVVVLAAPLAQRTNPARLTLDAIRGDQGERVGNAGHPVRPVTPEEHRALLDEVRSGRRSRAGQARS